MEVYEAETISDSLLRVKETQGTKSKIELAKELFSDNLHRSFLDMVGNGKRQWFTTWASVMKAKPSETDGFFQVFYQAENRLSTPSETASAIRGLLKEGYPDNVLKAIIEKTLDCGVTVESIKKSLGVVKRFSPSLASDWLDMKDDKRSKLLTDNPYVSTPKMDGLRCLFFCNVPGFDGAYSRALKPLKNLSKHHAELLRVVGKTSCVIDGEILADDNSWENSVTAVKKSGSTVSAVHYSFDYIPGDEFLKGSYSMPAGERFKKLDKILDKVSSKYFERVMRTRVFTITDVLREHDECVAEGWEGTVLHDLTASYACKRSTAWIKVKEFKSSEFSVVSFVAGTGKHRGRLGAMKVEGTYQGQKIASEVGTGFTDALREQIWADREGWTGAKVEIKFFSTTPDGSLRFPSFLRRRDLED